MSVLTGSLKHWLWAASILLLVAAYLVCLPRRHANADWGIDATLTRHATFLERVGYGVRLAHSRIGVLRERGVGSVADPSHPDSNWNGDVRFAYKSLKMLGYRIVALAQLPFKIKPLQAGDQLPEDLEMVFEQGRFMGREFTDLVDAWEMVGETDIGYCTDLPDRVAAYQKALYLGLKAGAAEAERKPETGSLKPEGSGKNSGLRSQVSGFARAPLVLMGALGMSPGPWLERAAANGLLGYTDAYNFHFYGHAEHMSGVIAAHRAAIATLSAKDQERRAEREVSATKLLPLTSLPTAETRFPLWITEAGLEAVSKDDFLNPQRRQLQADFTVSTAKQALAADDVAVFMPFILVHDKDPYAMTLSPFHTLPAWDAYAKFTRENPWPQRPLAREPHEVNPVVVQWLPDNLTCVPHKVSGTYRFRGNQPIKGELRVYNFADKPAKGRLEQGALQHSSALLKPETRDLKPEGIVTIPAMAMIAVPLEFTPTTNGYFRETWTVAFVEESGRQSPVSFGLEAEAKPADFTEEPLVLRALPNGVIRFPQVADYQPGEQIGVWTTINGLRAAQDPQISGLRSQVSAVRFWIEQPSTDPLAPTMAVASVDGLPATGFLRLQLDKPMAKDRKVLVVLVDDRGQRYTIWENFGADYYGSRSDIWLNLKDIHADFWGPMSADYQFKPERIREVHLRFYLNTPNDRVGVRLSLLKAR